MEKEKQAASQFWSQSPAGWLHASEKDSDEEEGKFEAMRLKRKEEELPSVLKEIPFHSFAKKKVLELGCGQGFDGYEFCKVESEYTGIDIAPENIKRANHNLSSFSPQVQLGDAENLSFKDETFDIVYSNGVLHHTPNMKQSFSEANRVLKKQSDFWVILYNKHSIFYILSICFLDQVIKGGMFKYSMKEKRSRIEFGRDPNNPPNVLVNVYTKKRLKQLLKDSNFDVLDIKIRKLNPEDFPYQTLVKRIWRYIPHRLIQFLEKRWGWYLIAHARKN